MNGFSLSIGVVPGMANLRGLRWDGKGMAIIRLTIDKLI